MTSKPVSHHELPVFSNVEEHRQHIKERLAAAFRVFYKLGFDQGVRGHIAARDPEHPELYWTNPYAVSFNQITTGNLLLLNYDGQIVEGEGVVHPGGTRLHIPLFKARPDVKVIAHTHSTYGKTWSTLNRLLDPLTTEAVTFYNRHALYDTLANGEGEKLAEALKGLKALILKNHGLVTVGDTVDETAFLFISMEEACKVQLLAEANGKTYPIEHERAEKLSANGNPYNAWLNFQPYYQAILKENPDLQP